MIRENQIVGEGEALYLEGLPRKCPYCGTWSRYKKLGKRRQCFTASCPSCHKEFEITPGVMPK